MKHPCQNISKASIFHEYWWLDAVTAGHFSEVEVRQGDYPAGRLPFVVSQRKGLRRVGMATQAADTAAKTVYGAALFGFITLLLGAIAGWLGGRMGAVEPTLPGSPPNRRSRHF